MELGLIVTSTYPTVPDGRETKAGGARRRRGEAAAIAAASGGDRRKLWSGGNGVGLETLPRASPTATRTLALVVLVAGAAFVAQLATREEYALLALFASQFVGFCVFTSMLALCALPEDGSQRRARRAVGQVLQWSLAMALPMSMAFWVVQSAPVAVGATLVGLALAVVFACYAELVRALWPDQGLH
ncbi:hypothetical protein PR202_ga19950 [Eleusine coracana subsp. coracana]|uniref:Uncharacterized protein n=1 Tax=Eleusine coracana subsp. coracana TaxID=191504 RepID=A0AAV5CWZ0_ELECO|nr:hypothetical protein PR202_ga19950 [Eleusine coracana subsp. coracana]